MRLLPSGHAAILQRLMEFLQKVDAHQEANKMSAANLAIIFAPSLMRSKEELSLDRMLQDNRDTTKLVQLMIEHYNDIFLVRF